MLAQPILGPYGSVMSTLSIDVWSDIACPWCFVGKKRLETALAQFPNASNVRVTWHSFELDPGAKAQRDPDISSAAHLAKKYGKTFHEAEMMLQRMTEVGAAEGIEFRFDRVRGGNTFDAHRLLHHAQRHNVQTAMKERLLVAYFGEGKSLSDRGTLASLAAEVGLDQEAVSEMLASDQYTTEVRQDENNARQLGISGVPFFVIGSRYGVSGAQPADALLQVIRKAWDETAPAIDAASGEVCGPESCA